MDIRSSLDSLKGLLGVTQPASTNVQQKPNGAANGPSALKSDQATLSSAGSQVAQAAGDSDVRMEKVNSIRAALVAGTYNVPASAVASKMIESLLSSDR